MLLLHDKHQSPGNSNPVATRTARHHKVALALGWLLTGFAPSSFAASGSSAQPQAQPLAQPQALSAARHQARQSAMLWVKRAEIASVKNDLNASVALSRKAIQIDPTYALAYNYLGGAYFRQGKSGLARIAFRKALALSPSGPDAQTAQRGLKMLGPEPRRPVVKTMREPLYPQRNLVAEWKGHTAGVLSVAFSPDRRTLASGSNDQTIRLWNLANGQARVLTGHTDRVDTVAFSPDGRTLASGSRDETVRLWNTQTGQLQKILSNRSGAVTSVAFSPGGKTLAGATAGAVNLWDIASGKLIDQRREAGPGIGVSSVAFSPDGQTVASASLQGRVRLWNVRSGNARMLPRHPAKITSVVFSPDGRTLASASGGEVRLWDTRSAKLRGLLTRGKGVAALAFAPGGHILACASRDRAVCLWNIQTGQLLWKLIGHLDSPSTVAFSPDGRTLASGSADRTINLWRIQ